MKRGRLPLTALRSFEAAGRLLSFSRAAEELFVSQAAVSRQIRELETLVGKPLFERLHRRVVLTDAGQQLIAQLTTSFDDIDRVLSRIVAEPAQAILKVSVEPSFAGALLIPRLYEFQKLHPEIDVTIDSDMRLVEFRSHEAEIAVRFSAVATSWPRTQAHHLHDVSLTPVLAPELLAAGPPLEPSVGSASLHAAPRFEPRRVGAMVRGGRPARNGPAARSDLSRFQPHHAGSKTGARRCSG